MTKSDSKLSHSGSKKIGEESNIKIPDEENSPVEQVRLTVSTNDDPTMPVWTFRMWFLGIVGCIVLSFLNTFFRYRSQPLSIGIITVQIASMPIGKFMEKVLPTKKFKIPGFGSKEFSFNPGPFNVKEHVLITILANAGSAYAIGIVTIIKTFYQRSISFIAAFILVTTTQILGYGFAGIFKKYVVDPSEMWWPGVLVIVSLFRAFHEKDEGKQSTSRAKFFVIVLICSFTWYIVPGYLFTTISNISLLCYMFPTSLLAQHIGSGMKGLGILSFTMDWATIASFLGSPLVSPFFAIINVLIGYIAIVYCIFPIAYWGSNMYNAQRFPMFSSNLFDASGHKYNVEKIVNEKFEIDMPAYNKLGRINISMFFAISYGLNFASVVATLVHVGLFNGKEIIRQFKSSTQRKPDIHNKLMAKYESIPGWWFHSLLAISLCLALALCIFLEHEVQLPWWGLIFSLGLAFIFTLPISIISATTNMSPGLNVITEYIIGYIYPGRPIANVCFKTYGYISMVQAISFLSDFKLGHYLKIPPKSMFLVQVVGTIVAGTVNLGVAWWLLTTVENICNDTLLPENSPWTCPSDRVFYDASVIWGLVGPRRMFGPLGNYNALNFGFLIGGVLPFLAWLLHKALPTKRWVTLINFPVILSATAGIPPASTLNFNSWIVVGIIFQFYVYRYKKTWWQKYNYVLSGGLDAGLAFMGVVIYFAFGIRDINLDWWGTQGEHCKLASCPTEKGLVVTGCPVQQ